MVERRTSHKPKIQINEVEKGFLCVEVPMRKTRESYDVHQRSHAELLSLSMTSFLSSYPSHLSLTPSQVNVAHQRTR